MGRSQGQKDAPLKLRGSMRLRAMAYSEIAMREKGISLLVVRRIQGQEMSTL